METIIGAAITGVLALAGVIITNIQSNRKIEQKLSTAQAVTDYKLEDLTREVRKHNNFAERVPAIEQEIKDIRTEIKLRHSNDS